MRNFINIINESAVETAEDQVVNEKLTFNGMDASLEAAFDNLCTSLNIHESGQNILAQKLERDGSYSRDIDPRSPINKVTPEQWARLNQSLAPYFVVRFDTPSLTIMAAK